MRVAPGNKLAKLLGDRCQAQVGDGIETVAVAVEKTPSGEEDQLTGVSLDLLERFEQLQQTIVERPRGDPRLPRPSVVL